MAKTLTKPLLIMGGTSLIGRHLLDHLEGSVSVPVFTLSRRKATHHDGITGVTGDLAHPESLKALPDLGAVICLTPVWLLTNAVLEALVARGMTRLIAFSSTSRFTKIDSPVASERAVAESLAAGEARVMRLAERGVGWTLMRPTLIYDEGHDQNVSRLAGLIRRFGVIPLAGDGNGLRQPVHAADLADAALAALLSPKAVNQAYHLSGGETLTYRSMVERIFAALGRRPRIVTLPPAVWRTLLWLASPVLKGATAGMARAWPMT